jgi:hypothetical protein
MHGKLQVIAGTIKKLFEKLADENAQDMDYIDTFLIHHAQFTTSINLLNQLISRFHLGPSPGEYEYFKKWQYSIQTKYVFYYNTFWMINLLITVCNYRVLNVIHRWIVIQYQDFKFNLDLQKRLNLFLFNNNTVTLQPQFQNQVEQIQSSLKAQIEKFSNDHQHHLSTIINAAIASSSNVPPSNTFNFLFPFVNNTNTSSSVQNINTRRPSNGLFHQSSSSSLPIELIHHHHDSTNTITTSSSYTSLESKDIARYLTLADYYLFKLIQTHGLWNNNCKNSEVDYVDLMTKRANMVSLIQVTPIVNHTDTLLYYQLSHWVVHEICSLSYLKPRRSLLKKFIEIAKVKKKKKKKKKTKFKIQ